MTRLAQGIDVSHHQDGPDGRLIHLDDVLEDDPDFVIWRTGDGEDLDSEAFHFSQLAERCDELGIPWGVYHYMRGRHSAEVQLEVVEEALGELVPPMGVWPDWEGDPRHETPRGRKRTRDERRHLGSYLPPDTPRGAAGLDPITPAAALDVLLRMLELLDERDLTGGIYGNWGLRPMEVDPRHAQLAERDLWIPFYNAPTGRPQDHRFGLPLDWETWRIHQITGRGKHAGIVGPVDINVWNGSAADLRAWVDARTRPEAEVNCAGHELRAALDDLDRARKRLGRALAPVVGAYSKAPSRPADEYSSPAGLPSSGRGERGTHRRLRSRRPRR